MRIQPIDASQSQTNFQAMKLPKLKVKPRVKQQLTPKEEQNRNYTQAIIVALGFIAAAFTKCFIDVCNGKRPQQAAVEIPAARNSEVQGDTFYWNK